MKKLTAKGKTKAHALTGYDFKSPFEGEGRKVVRVRMATQPQRNRFWAEINANSNKLFVEFDGIIYERIES